MVKTNPRIEDREERRRRRLKLREREIAKLIRAQQTTSSPPSNNPLKRRSPSSPSPSPSISSLSPPKFSLSSPVSTAFNGNYSDPPIRTQSLPGKLSFFDPKLPGSSESIPGSRDLVGQLPPLPPHPSQQLLRRTVSDPVPFGSFTPPHNNVSGSPSSGPDPISEKSSNSKRLRRMNKEMGAIKKMTFDEIGHGCSASQSTHICTCCSKEINDDNNDDDDEEYDDVKGKNRELAIGAERLGGEWNVIKINCPCGSDYQLLVSEAETKCFYKLV